MTYDIEIGRLEYPCDEAGDCAEPEIQDNEHPLAPAYPGSEKSRHRGLIMVPLFGKRANEDMLASAFKNYDPGLQIYAPQTWDAKIIPITEELAQRIARVLIQYKVDHPDVEPGFDAPVFKENGATLARLEILNWWVQYSLEQYGPNAAIRIS